MYKKITEIYCEPLNIHNIKDLSKKYNFDYQLISDTIIFINTDEGYKKRSLNDNLYICKRVSEKGSVWPMDKSYLDENYVLSNTNNTYKIKDGVFRYAQPLDDYYYVYESNKYENGWLVRQEYFNFDYTKVEHFNIVDRLF